MASRDIVDGTDTDAPTAFGLGARGLTGLLSPCERARTLTAASVNPDTVAATVFGTNPIRRGPLTIAAMCGQAFERRLVANDATKLKAQYEHDGFITGDPHVVDASVQGSPTRDNINQAVRTTIDAVRAAGPGPTLILQPALWLTVAGRQHLIHPDGLWIRGNEAILMEIKTYLDRNAFTDPVAFTSAVHQTAIGVAATEETFAKHNITLPVSPMIDLVFRHQSLSGVSIRRVDATPEITAVRTQLAEADQLVHNYDTTTRDGVTAIPHRYVPLCDRVCGMAVVCRPESDAAHGRGGIHGHPGLAVLDAAGITVIDAINVATGTVDHDDFNEPLRNGWNAAVVAPSITVEERPTPPPGNGRRVLTPAERRAAKTAQATP